MAELLLAKDARTSFLAPKDLIIGHRHLNTEEINILKSNRNINECASWQNIFVIDGFFDANLIQNTSFYGFVVFGKLRKASLKYHDLELACGVYNCNIKDTAIGDDCSLHEVAYLCNYRLFSRVILFNIQEMSCTKHSKFGEGILKEGEAEKDRIWIGVANENGGRQILAFKDMITADAALWAKYKADTLLQEKLIALTEKNNSKVCNTYGIVLDDAVIKNTTLLKDVAIGNAAYIKGAFKIKNVTILSGVGQESQIGEGVELVNGIMGYGSRVFYQAVAVRFLIGRNCQLKYGARLLNSVLGDNSTVSCCEILNNLIYPFHEQHHNSSFLIASVIQGQSNIASGATIGSNHNSRSPDGEVVAGRGFWPGLCTDFKHNSRFASFVLASKGSYINELNIIYPFSLIAPCLEDGTVHIIPAYWFIYNMFAMVRNMDKFKCRDRRLHKVQHIETNPFAPDTMQEIIVAVHRIIALTATFLESATHAEIEAFFRDNDKETSHSFVQYCGYIKHLLKKKAHSKATQKDILQLAKDFLHHNKQAVFCLKDSEAQKKHGAVLYKVARAYTEYRKVLKYYAAATLMEYCKTHDIEFFTLDTLCTILSLPLFNEWTNLGGQIISKEHIKQLMQKITSDTISSWQEVHNFYDECQSHYLDYKARHCIYVLEELYSKPMTQFDKSTYCNIIEDVKAVARYMYDSSVKSRQKDYDDPFRKVTYDNTEEMLAVIGKIENNTFLNNLKTSTNSFISRLEHTFYQVCK